MNIASLEKACIRNKVGLMNCSAQNTIALLNATHSATMRTSPDYKKYQVETSKSQILQSVFNVIWLGQTMWPDHDMFHSSDREVGESMSVTKAMSGGPIYLSDDPVDFNTKVIPPLCYGDGLLIRPLAPGVPLPASIFCDALYEEEKLYKVIAPLKNSSCAIAAYNLALDNEAKLTERIFPGDYRYSSAMMQPFDGFWKIPREGLVIYDWKEQKGSKLENIGMDVEITGFGHKLYILCPINKGWAVVGRPDKYLSASTVEILKTKKESIAIQLFEPGSIIIYSQQGNLKSDRMNFNSLGNGFHRGMIIGTTPGNTIVTITRE